MFPWSLWFFAETIRFSMICIDPSLEVVDVFIDFQKIIVFINSNEFSLEIMIYAHISPCLSSFSNDCLRLGLNISDFTLKTPEYTLHWLFMYWSWRSLIVQWFLIETHALPWVFNDCFLFFIVNLRLVSVLSYKIIDVHWFPLTSNWHVIENRPFVVDTYWFA